VTYGEERVREATKLGFRRAGAQETCPAHRLRESKCRVARIEAALIAALGARPHNSHVRPPHERQGRRTLRRGQLTENIGETLREVHGPLEADVALPVVKRFIGGQGQGAGNGFIGSLPLARRWWA
jgi:hypothetical protein